MRCRAGPCRCGRSFPWKRRASPTKRASCSCAGRAGQRSRATPKRSRRPIATIAKLALSRDGLKRIYVVTLSFALLMALFVAIAVAVTQSNLLAEPLANLAQATQACGARRFLAAGAGHEP